jgi:hypothetical protein
MRWVCTTGTSLVLASPGGPMKCTNAPIPNIAPTCAWNTRSG